jgi:hypothetical protein
MLSLSDGRDLLKEVATTGWRVGYKLLNIVELLPAFVANIEKDERLRVYGSFHFQVYRLN